MRSGPSAAADARSRNTDGPSECVLGQRRLSGGLALTGSLPRSPDFGPRARPHSGGAYRIVERTAGPADTTTEMRGCLPAAARGRVVPVRRRRLGASGEQGVSAARGRSVGIAMRPHFLVQLSGRAEASQRGQHSSRGAVPGQGKQGDLRIGRVRPCDRLR